MKSKSKLGLIRFMIIIIIVVIIVLTSLKISRNKNNNEEVFSYIQLEVDGIKLSKNVEIINNRISSLTSLSDNPQKEGFNFLYWGYKGKEVTTSTYLEKNATIVAVFSDTPEKKIIIGDVNEDGIVDSNDAEKLLNYSIGNITLSDQAKKNADVNVDGIINSTDQLILSKYVVGQYTTLPVTD